MRVFKVLDDKSILKVKMGDFIPLVLVRFPYNYLGENERFKPYIIREIVKCGFWSKTSSFGALLFCASPYCKIKKSKDYNFTIYYIDLACA